MSSPSSYSNLLSSPAFAHTARAEASTAAGLLRASKPSAESSDRFAQLMKTYASSMNAPNAPATPPSPPTAAAPTAAPPPATVARPPEGKTELQRQEQKLAQKNQTEASKPRPPATNQGAKSAGAAAAKAAGATTDTAATTNASTAQPAADKKTRAGDGDSNQLTAEQAAAAAAAAAADRNSANNAAKQTGLLGQAGTAVTQAGEAGADGADIHAATERSGSPAQLGASQARSAAHALQIDDTASLQAQQVLAASDSGAELDFGKQLQALLGSAAKELDGGVAAAAPKVEGASAESLIGMMAAAGSAAPAALDARSEVAGGRQITLSQPLTEAGFAPEMAARLSVLAADGVQEARLHLNPAEMGPVSVQIIIDGQQAQISFHAEHEQTRAVLEQSLPDLAAALRDSGLTLSGGGVFQQPGDQQGAAQSDPGSAPGADRRTDARLSVSAEAAPTPIRQSRGVVDLYA